MPSLRDWRPILPAFVPTSEILTASTTAARGVMSLPGIGCARFASRGGRMRPPLHEARDRGRRRPGL